MTTIDLCLSAPSRAALDADLLAAGLLIAHTALLTDPPQLVLTPVECVHLDYVGQLVDQPATYNTEQFPPVELSAATFLPGYRANVRLTGPRAASRAVAFASAEHAGDTAVIPAAEIPAAQRGRWGDEGFPWAPESLPVPPPEAPAPTIAQRRAQLLARLATRRWEVETGGIVVLGLAVATDDRSKLMLMGAAEQARRDPEWTTRWKTAGGWTDLTAEQVIAAADAALRHVQACFAREADLAEAIAAAPDRPALDALASQIEAFELPIGGS